ncbi:hypothetical protein PHMEG_0003246 [Phytophthora megakarya]|uniref:Chromo domain-containing protein n=1 Tax=Phytophthora megakarya TaxID=4795 RepID=A0A225WWI2_9STRA|nr:hypothetical protein PHMEG_0003246 [Phytophthora megakarya]
MVQSFHSSTKTFTTVITASSGCVRILSPSLPVDAADDVGVGVVLGINDRIWDGNEYRYRVQWKDEPSGYRWDDSWLTDTSLRGGGSHDACDIVDHWKKSKSASFYECCRSN